MERRTHDLPPAASPDECSRRSILRGVGAAFGVAALGPSRLLARSTSPSRCATAAPVMQQPFLVVVELEGGNDSLNTVVPTSLPNYLQLRPTLGLTTGETLALDSGPAATSACRFHPRLVHLTDMYRAGEVALVQKVGYPDPNGSHFESKDIWASGRRAEGRDREIGWIARYAESHAPTALGAVSVGRGNHSSFQGGGSSPLTMQALGGFQFDTDGAFRRNHDHRLTTIRDLLANSIAAGRVAASRGAIDQGHDLADQLSAADDDYVSTTSYANRSISNRLRDIAAMLQAGFETRIFYTGFGGFDTHGGQGKLTGRHPDLLRDLDDALFAFAEDCKAMGIWNQCVLAVVSEFGRRNFENGSGGTDHGGAGTVLLTGGGVRPGLYGPNLTTDDLDAPRFLPYGVDFRTIYTEILEQHLGVPDASSIFGEPREITAPVGLFV